MIQTLPSITSSVSIARAAHCQADDAMRGGQWVAAFGHLERAHSADPNDPFILLDLGWVTFRVQPGSEHARTRALGHLERALSLDPSLTMAHYRIGRIHRVAGQLGLARKSLKRFLEHHPRDAEGLTELEAIDRLLEMRGGVREGGSRSGGGISTRAWPQLLRQLWTPRSRTALSRGSAAPLSRGR